jgi:hypothetical protein
LEDQEFQILEKERKGERKETATGIRNMTVKLFTKPNLRTLMRMRQVGLVVLASYRRRRTFPMPKRENKSFEFHDSAVCGHRGVNKTYRAIHMAENEKRGRGLRKTVQELSNKAARTQVSL